MIMEELNERPIFINKGLLSFAWAGGRLLILDKNDELTDFGDGMMSHGRRNVGNMEFNHDRLGLLHASDTKFNFKGYGIEFDFDEVRNSHFLNRNKNIGREWALLYHLKRFHQKHKTS